MAATLRKEPGVQVEVIDGAKGELTVLVDGKEVAHKGEHSLPQAAQVLAALQGSKSATAG